MSTKRPARKPLGEDALAHTYSIVARDKATGEMGVAVQSHWFAVGSIVTWGEAGVGVIAIQSFLRPSFGPMGLALMRAGLTSEQTLKALIEQDDGREMRQLAILDAKGRAAVHTGKDCIPYAGHYIGGDYSVQANLMRNEDVWPAMAEAFEGASGTLEERLLTALEAGEKAGGDIRGKQSAAILVVAESATEQPWLDRVLDLHVEDHDRPLEELRRLFKVHRAYEYMNRGDVAMIYGDTSAALQAYKVAESIFPEKEEVIFWKAVSLANGDKMEDALLEFQKVFAMNTDWRDLVPRIAQVGLLKVSDADLDRIVQMDAGGQ